jgi:putative CocE/NonD family hydrolase
MLIRNQSLRLAFIYVALISSAKAQQIDFPEPPTADSAALSNAMAGLAKKVISVYKDDGSDKYLDNLFRLRMVAGDFSEAGQTLIQLREMRAQTDPRRAAWVNVQYEIYAQARVTATARGLPFERAYHETFREVFRSLDDRTSALVARVLVAPDLSVNQRYLENGLKRQIGQNTISLADALQLVRDYQVDQSYRTFAPIIPSLIAEDDARRYVIEKDVQVKTADGATVCALIVRPRAPSRPLPTLLNFTIYADPKVNFIEGRRSASNGYAGVVGLTRGKECSPDQLIPYEHDGSDSSALIDWITTQPWSDGRVGMYGGSYEGFTAWSTAKYMPKGLKAIMAGAPVAPGIDVPMEGNIVWNFVYPWPFYTTDNETLDDATYGDNARWNKLNHDWYVSGRPYRDLDQIDGKANPIFDRWIAHPSYDSYWQGAIPYAKEFARIGIPVLQTAGYYFGGPGAAVYYLEQHYKYFPKAEHYLVIGPYDHLRGHRGTLNVFGDALDTIAGYKLDPVAQIDMGELRYQWFDYVFKAAPKPALLKDKINYEITGANVWKHAPSIAAMTNSLLRLYLTSARSGGTYRLSEARPAENTTIPQTINFADRSDVDQMASRGILSKSLDSSNGLVFASDPVPSTTEISGLFSGRLEFITNKKDFDFNVVLYELTAAGEYFQLAPFWARASYVGHISDRRLLTPGKRQRLAFRSIRLTSHQLQAGSRIVLVLSVIKEPGRQINYGTGKDVSDETLQGTKSPLEIKWLDVSYIELPVEK